MDEFLNFVDLIDGPLTLALTVFGVAYGLFRFFTQGHQLDSLPEQFRDPASYPHLLRDYNATAGETYFKSLRWVLGSAHRIYGPRSLSWRAFGTCLIIAFAYPVIAMVIAWTAANVHSPGGLALFADIDSIWQRLWRTAALVVGGAVAIWIVRNAERFANWVVDRTFGPLETATPRAGLLLQAARGVVAYVAFAFAVAGAFAITGAVAVAVAFAGAGAVAGAFAVAVAFAGALAGALAFAFAVAGAFAVAFAGAVALINGDLQTGALLIFLYTVLPLLNATADMLSLAATRWFLRNVVRKRHGRLAVLTGFVADLVAAGLCLALLLGTLVGVLQLWATISPSTVPLDWRAYWAEAQAEPAKGIALYLMVFTTLLPTLIHMVAAGGALLTHKSRALRRVANRLKAKMEQGGAYSLREASNEAMAVRRAYQWGYGLTTMVAVLLIVLVIWWIFGETGTQAISTT